MCDAETTMTTTMTTTAATRKWMATGPVVLLSSFLLGGSWCCWMIVVSSQCASYFTNSLKNTNPSTSVVLNVLDFGAKGDGRTGACQITLMTGASFAIFYPASCQE
jgi:hypothetical protein